LSVILTKAARLPMAEGVNVMLSVQLPPVATELPQLWRKEKSLALAPVTTRLLMAKVTLLVLVSVAV